MIVILFHLYIFRKGLIEKTFKLHIKEGIRRHTFLFRMKPPPGQKDQDGINQLPSSLLELKIDLSVLDW